MFAGKIQQYVFISTATVYQKPPRHYVVTEETPLENPFWEYSQKKIAAEQYLMHQHRRNGFPVTIVRPSFTYGDTWIPTAFGIDFTSVHRMREGLPLPLHGDGTSLWVMTHASDFAKGLLGLLGRPDAVGEAFHITSDEVMSWNQGGSCHRRRAFRRQGALIGLRQLQDQALRARVPLHGFVGRGPAPHHRLARRPS
jgi:nucleoside-diphosphate-sugar epimerase